MSSKELPFLPANYDHYEQLYPLDGDDPIAYVPSSGSDEDNGDAYKYNLLKKVILPLQLLRDQQILIINVG